MKTLRSFFLKAKINQIAIKWFKFLSKLGSQVFSFKSKSLNDNLALLLQYKTKDYSQYSNQSFFKDSLRFSKQIEKLFSQFKRLKLKLSLNKNKFEERFLNKLSLLITKYYGKKVEFNIVNLKNIAYNSDIFTEILTLKLKKERSKPVDRMNSLLSKVVLPGVNTIVEKGRIEKQVNYNIVDSKYRNFNINSIINQLSVRTPQNNVGVYVHSFKDNLNKLLYNLYYKNTLENSTSDSELSSSFLNKAYYTKLRDIIFENIKYKVMRGARLTVKGRLSKRYRADRAVYKFKWKGGLKNIDSSYKGISSVMFRGYLDSNMETSKLSSKRRIGSFGVKSWFSGK